MMFLLTGC